jgi:hypothetical protein
MIGLAWRWHLRLAEKGKDATAFPTALASYAARAVRSGSRIAGQERANDVLSPVAQRRHHFFVGRLPDFETLTEHPLNPSARRFLLPPKPPSIFSTKPRCVASP